MFNYASRNKKLVFIIVFFLLVFCSSSSFKIAFADNEEIEQEFNDTTNKILDDIDFSSLDQFVDESNFDNLSFKDCVDKILNDEYLFDYNSVFSFIKSLFLDYLNNNLRFLILIFILLVMYCISKSFLPDKFSNFKTLVKICFSFVLGLIALGVFKNYYNVIFSYIEKMFSFAQVLFPILISLITLSGAAVSSSLFGTFSVFILDTGLYLLKFVLLPLSLSILLLSLFSSFFSKNKFGLIVDFLKMIFKYIIIVFFIIFGLFSTVSIVSSGVKDGVNIKLTKFALKSYIPVLGGYVADGFDYLHSCSILVKNSIGVCSIFVFVSSLISPLFLTIVFALGFKLLSVVSGFIDDGEFSALLGDVSKSFSNFLTIIIGTFLIFFLFIFLLIISVKVV